MTLPVSQGAVTKGIGRQIPFSAPTRVYQSLENHGKINEQPQLVEENIKGI
jgi:hypothetical protein